MAAKKNCGICGTSLTPLYATVKASASTEEMMAVVQMRQGILIDSSDGLRRLLPGETVKLSFSIIENVLTKEGPILYFDRKTDEAKFKLKYPEAGAKLR